LLQSWVSKNIIEVSKMTNNDPLAACLSKINNAEKVSKKDVTIQGISKMKKTVLEIFKKCGYIKEIEYKEDNRGGHILIKLNNLINKCGSIKPRYNVTITDIERFEQRYLPAKGFGVLLISTSQGMLTNIEAKEKNLGGKLVAYCY
jgi:small subunit ribosomal protein S8